MDLHPIDWRDHKVDFATQGVEGKAVLDLGCVQHDREAYTRPYWIHRALCAKAASVTGLDCDGEGVEYLRAKGYDIHHGDAQGFALGRKFEMIFAGDLIEHLEDFGGFLESCKAHLGPGGEIRISTPNPWFWRFVLQALVRDEVPVNPEHTCWLCPRTLRQLVRRHGLDMLSVRYGSRRLKDRVLPLPKRWKHMSWHAVVRPI